MTLPDGKQVAGESWRTTPYDVAAGISKGLADSCVIAKVCKSVEMGLLNGEILSTSVARNNFLWKLFNNFNIFLLTFLNTYLPAYLIVLSYLSVCRSVVISGKGSYTSMLLSDHLLSY